MHSKHSIDSFDTLLRFDSKSQTPLDIFASRFYMQLDVLFLMMPNFRGPLDKTGVKVAGMSYPTSLHYWIGGRSGHTPLGFPPPFFAVDKKKKR